MSIGFGSASDSLDSLIESNRLRADSTAANMAAFLLLLVAAASAVSSAAASSSRRLLPPVNSHLSLPPTPQPATATTAEEADVVLRSTTGLSQYLSLGDEEEEGRGVEVEGTEEVVLEAVGEEAAEEEENLGREESESESRMS